MCLEALGAPFSAAIGWSAGWAWPTKGSEASCVARVAHGHAWPICKHVFRMPPERPCHDCFPSRDGLQDVDNRWCNKAINLWMIYIYMYICIYIYIYYIHISTEKCIGWMMLKCIGWWIHNWHALTVATPYKAWKWYETTVWLYNRSYNVYIYNYIYNYIYIYTHLFVLNFPGFQPQSGARVFLGF